MNRSAERGRGEMESLQTHETWRKLGKQMGILELQEFSKFICSTREHEEGKIACLQLGLDEPLEVHFISDKPDDDSEFRITQNNSENTFSVTLVKGDNTVISPFLSEFGFELAEDLN